MRKHCLVWISLFGVCFALPGWSAEKKGVKMPDQISESGHSLVLNGLGVRKAYGMVSVYVAGLYLEKASHDPNEIVRSKEQERLVLHFLMDVDQEKIREAWSGGFARNCPVECKPLGPDIQLLNGWMGNMRSGQEMSFDLSADSMAVTVNGVPKGTIKGDNFRQQFLTLFLGPNPPNKGLKDGLLGLAP